MLNKIINNPIISFFGAIGSIIALLILIASISIAIYRLRKKLWKALKKFVNSLVIYSMSLVLVVFFIVVWIFEGKLKLLTIPWVGLLSVLLAVLIWVLGRRVFCLKRDLNRFMNNRKWDLSNLKDEFRRDLETFSRRVSVLETHAAMPFEDDFKKDWNKNWDYRGLWKLESKGILRVTQSERGGITRRGYLWTDYSFEFTAIMVNKCIGWIVRAQDFSNYYMIQLNSSEVRPHLRVGGIWIAAAQKKYGLAIDSKEHGLLSITDKAVNSQAGSFRVRTEVRGLEIRVYVDNQEIYSDPRFFSMRFINKDFQIVQFEPGVSVVPPFTTGRVGFRESGEEQGWFSECRVRALR